MLVILNYHNYLKLNRIVKLFYKSEAAPSKSERVAADNRIGGSSRVISN